MTCPKCGKDTPADWILCKDCMPNSPSKKSANSRKIPASYQRNKRITHPFRNITVSIILLAAILTAFFFECGFYTIPPIDPIPQGATLLIWRYGDISEPFFNSPDAAMSKTPTVDSLIDVIPASRTIVQLPYIEFFYLQSPIGEVPADAEVESDDSEQED